MVSVISIRKFLAAVTSNIYSDSFSLSSPPGTAVMCVTPFESVPPLLDIVFLLPFFGHFVFSLEVSVDLSSRSLCFQTYLFLLFGLPCNFLFKARHVLSAWREIGL